jgi:sarcosine oxidase subunit alpha
MSAAALCAQRTNTTLRETGSTTARPPVEPVSLGLLAGAHHHPVKLTPMHYKHLAAGASQMDMGVWKRPRYYTSEAEEWKAVREAVGIIDVGTLGKLDVKGADAGALLDKVYTHVFSQLKPGRVRYGVICNDEGIILDDGTVSRLSESHYFITTTTGNVDFVEAWLNWWLAGTGMCAHITNVTGDYAAVNVAGPRARDTLRKLTEADLAPEKFSYMMCCQADVAGVPAILLRIGFVGETGWEIHYPACYGEYLWDALLEAGAEFGIKPFGVETQRTLRLEKKHIIVGQDTDALSTPLEADMAWCVKFEKSDFIGKPGLRFLQSREQEQKLVGFVLDTAAPIAEGSVVVEQGKPLGRVTSARVSPYLGRSVGMAWVPMALAQEGAQIEIRSDGQMLIAKVVDRPFYDPEGKKLRE